MLPSFVVKSPKAIGFWYMLQIADSTGERLGTLSEKLWRCRPEDQKLPEGFASAAPLIHQASKHWKQVRQPLNLIKDDQMVCKLAKIKFGGCQFGDVGRALQIEIMNRLSKPRASVMLPTCREPSNATTGVFNARVLKIVANWRFINYLVNTE